jgi:hypothetical protein
VAGEDVVLEVDDRRDLAVGAAIGLIKLLVVPHVLRQEEEEHSSAKINLPNSVDTFAQDAKLSITMLDSWPSESSLSISNASPDDFFSSLKVLSTSLM